LTQSCCRQHVRSAEYNQGAVYGTEQGPGQLDPSPPESGRASAPFRCVCAPSWQTPARTERQRLSHRRVCAARFIEQVVELPTEPRRLLGHSTCVIGGASPSSVDLGSLADRLDSLAKFAHRRGHAHCEVALSRCEPCAKGGVPLRLHGRATYACSALTDGGVKCCG
jgi:hypothetical protein